MDLFILKLWGSPVRDLVLKANKTNKKSLAEKMADRSINSSSVLKEVGVHNIHLFKYLLSASLVLKYNSATKRSPCPHQVS